MNKSKLKIIFGALIVIIALAGFFGVKWVKENNSIEEIVGNEYIPEMEISDEDERKTIVNLYFPSKDMQEIKPEARLIDVRKIINLPYEALMNLLIDGPKNEKLAKIIPKGTRVLRTFTERDCLVLDLTKEFLNYDMEQENTKDNLINSIVYTMTELTEINKVKFLIEGKENEQFNETYKRN